MGVGAYKCPSFQSPIRKLRGAGLVNRESKTGLKKGVLPLVVFLHIIDLRLAVGSPCTACGGP